VALVLLQPSAPRAVLLIQRAYEEEGLECPNIDERRAPTKLLFPRSYVDAVDAMSGEKVHDYSFLGTLYRPETFEYRRWILDFVKTRFTERSYLLISDDHDGHVRLGSFDHTGDRRHVFVPKEVPLHERARFNPAYFEVLRHSEFTLCPAGDQPWSMRFFEAVMCRSIPIVSDPSHAGRNELERAIGYRFYLRDDDHVYDADLVEENHQRFLHHQTLIANSW
jgi:hypothetical protein